MYYSEDVNIFFYLRTFYHVFQKVQLFIVHMLLSTSLILQCSKPYQKAYYIYRFQSYLVCCYCRPVCPFLDFSIFIGHVRRDFIFMIKNKTLSKVKIFIKIAKNLHCYSSKRDIQKQIAFQYSIFQMQGLFMQSDQSMVYIQIY